MSKTLAKLALLGLVVALACYPETFGLKTRPAPVATAVQGTSFRTGGARATSTATPLPGAPTFQADSAGVYEVKLDSLARFECPFNTKVAPTIPASILALDGQKVRVRGFMIPFKVNGDRVLSFALVKNQLACCYGVALRPHEWILVRMPEGKTAPLAMVDHPIELEGQLAVGAEFKQGMLAEVYRLTATRLRECSQP